jgi:hypothetical protein
MIDRILAWLFIVGLFAVFAFLNLLYLEQTMIEDFEADLAEAESMAVYLDDDAQMTCDEPVPGVEL